MRPDQTEIVPQHIGKVLSVNVGRPRSFELKGRTFTSAIWKEPVSGRLNVRGVNVEGDDQADRSVHGGFDKAVYAYAEADYRWWDSALGRTVAPGTFGENLTIGDLRLNDCVIGERWAVGTTVLEVAQPRVPCFKLGFRMSDPDFPRKFAEAARWGAYLRIIEEGGIAAGDQVKLLLVPDHGVTVAMVAHAYFEDHQGAEKLLDAPQLPEGWRAWAAKAVRRSGSNKS